MNEVVESSTRLAKRIAEVMATPARGTLIVGNGFLAGKNNIDISRTRWALRRAKGSATPARDTLGTICIGSCGLSNTCRAAHAVVTVSVGGEITTRENCSGGGALKVDRVSFARVPGAVRVSTYQLRGDQESNAQELGGQLHDDG